MSRWGAVVIEEGNTFTVEPVISEDIVREAATSSDDDGWIVLTNQPTLVIFQGSIKGRPVVQLWYPVP